MKLSERLESLSKSAAMRAENNRVVAGHLSPEIDSLHSGQGHNTYAVRMAVEHRNNARADEAESETLREAADLARRVEESAKAIGSKDACTDECTSIIMHIGNGGRAKDARGRWFHLVPVEGMA